MTSKFSESIDELICVVAVLVFALVRFWFAGFMTWIVMLVFIIPIIIFFKEKSIETLFYSFFIGLGIITYIMFFLYLNASLTTKLIISLLAIACVYFIAKWWLPKQLKAKSSNS